MRRLALAVAILQIAEWVQEFAVGFIRRNVARSSGDARALASAFNIIKWFISVAVWSGASEATQKMFHWIAAGIAVPALLYSAQVFVVSAWSALKHARS